MSALFLKTADNEKEHAKMWFKELAGIGDTKETWRQRQKAKIMSGQICMMALLKQLRKKYMHIVTCMDYGNAKSIYTY